MARALGASHAPVPYIAADTVFLCRCDEEDLTTNLVDVAGATFVNVGTGFAEPSPGLFWPSDLEGLYGARDFTGTQQQEATLTSAQQALFRADTLTLELWFELDAVTGTQRFVSVSGDLGSELEADNFLFAVGVVGAELNVFHETGAGANVSNTTAAAQLKTGRVYKLGVVRRPSSNRNPAKCDVEVHIWDKLSGARYFEVFKNVALPTGGGNARLVIGGEYNASTGANQLNARLDDIRVVTYSASMEAMRNTFFRGVRPWEPDYLNAKDSTGSVLHFPRAVTKILRVRVETPHFDEAADLEWTAAVSYADATTTEGDAFELAPSSNGSSFTLSSGTLPPGTTLHAGTGLISGTPTTPGTYANIVIEVSGPGGTATSAPFKITIESAAAIHVAYAASTATLGSAFSLAPTTNGTSFVLVAGTLPDGLALNAGNGFITGTLTAAGLLALDATGLVVRATNGFGSADSAAFTIAVQGVSLPTPAHYFSMDDSTIVGATIVGEGSSPVTADIIGTVTTGVAGGIGEQIELPGTTGNRLEVPNTQPIVYPTSLTACIIATPDDPSTFREVFAMLPPSTAAHGFYGMSIRVGAVANRARFYFDGGNNTGSTSNSLDNTSHIAAGQRVSIVAALENSTLEQEIWIDGIKEARRTANDSIAWTADASPSDPLPGIDIGRHPFFDTRYWDGKVDEAALWSSFLTANQKTTVGWLALAGRSIGDWVGL